MGTDLDADLCISNQIRPGYCTRWTCINRTLPVGPKDIKQTYIHTCRQIFFCRANFARALSDYPFRNLTKNPAGLAQQQRTGSVTVMQLNVLTFLLAPPEVQGCVPPATLTSSCSILTTSCSIDQSDLARATQARLSRCFLLVRSCDLGLATG